ncbi:MAG: aminotransferase class V-fold PLP-dependent enzyme [Pseudomonadales bacterium]|nr:aminotransferase class V-fold PLP-dependent enzyme [Pseudomonadales bacterium]
MNTLINRIRDEVIGQQHAITTPFGSKPLVYADYTASGRSLAFLEEFIRSEVLPYYANTHTETTFTGARTTAWRESARAMVRRAVNGSEDDKIIFCGAGATAAINRFIDILGLRQAQDQPQSVQKSEETVVFIGPYEHHSNELPWRESQARVEVIPLDACGGIDAKALEEALQKNQGCARLIGSFSAASNVTGIKSDVAAITALLKRYGALACWDYAAAGPYLRIDMNGAVPLDAVFLSPHKFVGGPGTPGILIAKQTLFQNAVPGMIGGGTVAYVTPLDHVYIQDIERREEGGTPAIVESIRAGLVFSLQQQVGLDNIQAREHELAERAMQRLQACPNIEVLGNPEAARLPIFSLRFWHAGQELHYGFVVSLLNDLFGIQLRGGCSCAGPYAHSLLGMNMAYSKRLEAAVTEGVGVMRPGWVRLNFNYFLAEEEFDYLLRALELVAEYGWQLLPWYRYDSRQGVWRYAQTEADRVDLMARLDWEEWLSQPQPQPQPEPSKHPRSLAQEMILAEQTLHAMIASAASAANPAELLLSAEHEAMRWFVTPREAAAACRQKAGDA